MRFVIVTGMSGAGKSTALKYLEDAGYFCADNLPPSLMPKFAELCFQQIDKVALGIDTRGGRLFQDLFTALENVKAAGYPCEILFLDASDKALVKRYKETRRSHPLSRSEVNDGIRREREILADVKRRADYIIDTSNILPRELKEQIYEIFVEGKTFESLMITIRSFGFKYGIPSDCDLVFDVRFLPNPYYIPELKPQTGLDAPVRDYVMQFPETRVFLDKLTDMLEFLIPQYIREGKHQLVIGIGCTGGKHRSVAIACALYQALSGSGHSLVLKHEHIEQDDRRK